MCFCWGVPRFSVILKHGIVHARLWTQEENHLGFRHVSPILGIFESHFDSWVTNLLADSQIPSLGFKIQSYWPIQTTILRILEASARSGIVQWREREREKPCWTWRFTKNNQQRKGHQNILNSPPISHSPFIWNTSYTNLGVFRRGYIYTCVGTAHHRMF